MVRIDITTTATLRPEILDATYASFKKHLFHDWAGYRVLLNVDPVGDDCPADDVAAVARKHFDDVVVNAPTVANFSRAVRWCWCNVRSEYFFNLEDDWLLFEDVDLLDMVRIMEANQDLALLRLSMFPSRADTCRQWNRHVPWNGDFFEIPDELKCQLAYSGHPSLIRTSFIRPTISYIRDTWCPEKTLKGYHPQMRRWIMRWRFGVHQKPMSRAVMRDNGRRWREARRWYKHRGYSFTTWQPLPDGYDEKTYYRHLRDKGVM